VDNERIVLPYLDQYLDYAQKQILANRGYDVTLISQYGYSKKEFELEQPPVTATG
jgi:hypothetical protein